MKPQENCKNCKNFQVKNGKKICVANVIPEIEDEEDTSCSVYVIADALKPKA
jgi:hypothetical protein